MPRRVLLFFTALYVLSCALYFFSSLAVTEAGYPSDDAWIHQVFARNIATGHGFSFNPDVPMAGATAPLWTLLMALLWPLLGPIVSGLSAGVILMWLALIGAYKVAIVLTADETISKILLFSCTLCTPLVIGALSGMEVGLYSALSLWGLYFYLKAESFNSRINYLAYLLFSLAILARPECALFWVAAAVRDFWEWIRSPKKTFAPWIWRLLILGVIIAPYFIFNYSTTGTLFPQTYTAKAHGKGVLSAIVNGDLKHLLKSISAYPYLYLQDFLVNLLFLSPILFLAMLPGMLKMFSVDDRLKSKRIMLVVLMLLYIPLMGAVAPVLNATYQSMRLIANLIPLCILFGLIGFWGISKIRYGNYMILSGAALGLLGGLMILANSYIVRFAAPYLVGDMSHFTSGDFAGLAGVIKETGRNIAVIGGILGIGFLLSLEKVQNALSNRVIKPILGSLIAVSLLGPLIVDAHHYAREVASINNMDRSVGRRLQRLGHGTVATGDIGAIAYYSGMTVFDLRGLVSPELSNAAMIDDSLSVDYMLKHNRVDYVAVYPEHFGYIAKRSDLFAPIGVYADGTGDDTRDNCVILYRATWPDSLDIAKQGVR